MTKRGISLLAASAVGLAALLLAAPAHAIGTPAGTVISNQATVDYEDVNGNPLQALSNVVTTTVSQVAAVDVSPDNATSADPGDVVYYAHVVTNNGNGDDTIDMTAVSSNGWTVQIYYDVNGNGLYDAGTDLLLTDTDADGVPDTGVLAHDTTYDLLVAVTVPTGAADGTVDTTTVTGTSSFDVNVFDTATDTTTIQAPALTVVKSVAPLGDQPPLTILTYTVVITNGGTGQANGIVLTDPIPTNTTYQAGTITLDGAGKTDAAGDDEADYNVTNPGEITVNVGSLAAGASATVTFQVQID